MIFRSAINRPDLFLSNIMESGLTGQEATVEIRNDPRFRKTQRLFDEMSSAAETLGKTFGFIA